MGLDTTHDAFHGAYSAFQRFRRAVARAANVSYPPHADANLDPNTWYWNHGTGNKEKYPGLTAFFTSDDCQGSFTPATCLQMADEIEALLPKIREQENVDENWGHIAREGGMASVAEKYIAGCRLAASLGEDLEYH
jgi:hypothetical protein